MSEEKCPNCLREEELRYAYHREFNAIHGILAEALKYDYDVGYGWVTGDHTEVSLAMEARCKIRELEERSEG